MFFHQPRRKQLTVLTKVVVLWRANPQREGSCFLVFNSGGSMDGWGGSIHAHVVCILPRHLMFNCLGTRGRWSPQAHVKTLPTGVLCQRDWGHLFEGLYRKLVCQMELIVSWMPKAELGVTGRAHGHCQPLAHNCFSMMVCHIACFL